MFRLDASFRAVLKERLDAFVPKALDHANQRIAWLYSMSMICLSVSIVRCPQVEESEASGPRRRAVSAGGTFKKASAPDLAFVQDAPASFGNRNVTALP
jgi:hypothetical protein